MQVFAKTSLAVITLLAVACNDTKFRGKSAGKESASASVAAGQGVPGANGNGQDQLGKGTGNGEGNFPGGPNDPFNPGGDGNPNGSGTDGLGSSGGPNGSLTPTEAQEKCLLKKADNYNFAFVFDSSGSTNTTDPKNVRRLAASRFMIKFSNFVAKHTSSEINMATIYFSDASHRARHGWVKLDPLTAPNVQQDIDEATANFQGNTHYIPALKDASALLTEKGASVSNKRQRNYVIFMTDGLPNLGQAGETETGIYAETNNMVGNLGVAVIGIASGSAVPPQGEQIVRNMSLPLTGIVDATHVGLYKRAVTDADLENAWDFLFQSIAKCD